MGNLIQHDFGGEEQAVGKKRLAQILRRSVRWIEYRLKEGMPSAWEGNRRVFVLSEVRRWLEDHGHSAGDRKAPTAPATNGQPTPEAPAEPESPESDQPPDDSRAAAIAALEDGIASLQHHLAVLKGENGPAA